MKQIASGWRENSEYLKNYHRIDLNERNLLDHYLSYLRFLFAYKIAAEYIDEESIVLDVGYAGGHGLRYMSQKCKNIAGLDISRNALLFAREHDLGQRKANLVQGTAFSLPFKSGAFDVITSFQVIEHLDTLEVKIFLNEVKRCLRSDGLFIYSTPNKRLRLLPFQKSWNQEHKIEYDFKGFQKILRKSFESLELFSICACTEITELERARVRQNPLIVYLPYPMYRSLSKILPKSTLADIASLGHSVLITKKKISRSPFELFNDRILP